MVPRPGPRSRALDDAAPTTSAAVALARVALDAVTRPTSRTVRATSFPSPFPTPRRLTAQNPLRGATRRCAAAARVPPSARTATPTSHCVFASPAGPDTARTHISSART